MANTEYTARNAQIVEEPEKTANADESMFLVVNTRTGEVVGRASTMVRARRILDKRDNEYGGYIHKIVRPITPTPAG